MDNLDKLDPSSLMDYIKKRYSNDSDFKQKFDTKGIASSSAGSSSSIADDIVTALSKATIGNSFTTSPPIFSKGDNFNTHCCRFAEFVEVARLSAEQQFAVFMQGITDDQTYSRVRDIEVSHIAKMDYRQFIPVLKKGFYGENLLLHRSKLHDCVQKSTESIADYVFNLRQKAELAYPDIDGDINHTNRAIRDEQSLLVFLKGVFNPNIKRKLNESVDIKSFSEAVRQAKRLESVDKMMTSSSSGGATGILRNEARFGSKDHSLENDQYRSRPRNRESSRERRDSSSRDNRDRRSSSRDQKTRDSRKCFACGGNHLVKDCTELREFFRSRGTGEALPKYD